jgi:hemoglobin
MDQTLYDHLGGRDTITAVVDGLYSRLLEDEQIAPVFADVDLTRLRSHMTTFLSAALGSQDVYAGRDLFTAHAGLGITDEMFDRTLVHLVGVLVAAEVPEDTVALVIDSLTPLRAQVVHGAVLT